MNTKTVVTGLPVAKMVRLPTRQKTNLDLKGDLGVENIKDAFKTILELGEKLVELGKDFSITKALPIVFELAKYQTYVDTFKQALNEFRDGISPEESYDISEALKIDFDIANNSLEAAIEDILTLLPGTYQYLHDTIINGAALYEGWKVNIINLRSLKKKQNAA